jgi:hypothetical protein
MSKSVRNYRNDQRIYTTGALELIQRVTWDGIGLGTEPEQDL